jgi:hypothetical protein
MGAGVEFRDGGIRTLHRLWYYLQRTTCQWSHGMILKRSDCQTNSLGDLDYSSTERPSMIIDLCVRHTFLDVWMARWHTANLAGREWGCRVSCRPSRTRYWGDCEYYFNDISFHLWDHWSDCQTRFIGGLDGSITLISKPDRASGECRVSWRKLKAIQDKM